MNLFTSPAAATPVDAALRQASAETGVGFDYLFQTAYRESGLEPGAKASTSSATGLFQFIESTWLRTVKEEGPKYGLAQYSRQIGKTADGRYEVADPAQRAGILELRKDPRVSALMAGALTQRNGEHLRQQLGRDATGGELYIAHFLGSGEAGRLLRMAETDPAASAADAFPKAAEANRPIFYHAGGASRSVAEVRDELVSRHGETSGLSRLVSKIERKVASFFSSLFHFMRAEREMPGGGHELSGAQARQRMSMSYAEPPRPELRPDIAALERLTAKAAYDAQIEWFDPAHRPELPVLDPQHG